MPIKETGPILARYGRPHQGQSHRVALQTARVKGLTPENCCVPQSFVHQRLTSPPRCCRLVHQPTVAEATKWTMPTIYSISEGSYSDYGVRRLYTNQKDAERDLVYYRDGFIEEFKLDEPVGAPFGMFPFSVNITLESGTITGIWQEDVEDFEPSCARRGGRGGIADYIRVGTWARDKDHAAKIATEKRREVLANEL